MRRMSTAMIGALAVVTAALPLTDSGSVPEADALPAPRTIDNDHPYSMPTWYPLRDSGAGSSCVRTNCERNGKPFHGEWAIDWNADRGDPVHAAGWGIAHVGGRQVNCETDHLTSNTAGRGNWVWIDHGGSVVSLYYHLDTLTPDLEGMLVDPTTQIGTIGSSGSPCRKARYLHYEVKTGGIRGESIYMGSLSACLDSRTRISLPEYVDLDDGNGGTYNVSNWDDMPYRPNPRMPETTSGCIPDSVPATVGAPAAPAVTHSTSSSTVTWRVPTKPVRETMISIEKYSTLSNVYLAATYQSADPTKGRATITGLALGSKYRFRVAHRNGAGWSRWSKYTQTVFELSPSTPTGVTTESGTSFVAIDWDKAVSNGSTITGYEVSRRRRSTSGDWGRWGDPVTVTGTQYRFTDLPRATTYQLRVRTVSNRGVSGWTKARTVSTT